MKAVFLFLGRTAAFSTPSFFGHNGKLSSHKSRGIFRQSASNPKLFLFLLSTIKQT